MQMLYTYSGRDVAESRRTLANMVHNEFTDGDVEVEQPVGEVRSFIHTQGGLKCAEVVSGMSGCWSDLSDLWRADHRA